MMNNIARIIFEMLASGRGVYLPDVGSLYVERSAAKFISKKEIRPPYNKAVFSRREVAGAESIVDIMVAGGMSREDAGRDYAEWIKRIRNDKGILEISEVGVVKHDFFYPSAALHDRLNPEGKDNVILRSQGNGGRMALTALIILVVVATAIIVAVSLTRYFYSDKNGPEIARAMEQVAAPEAERINAPGDGEASPEDAIQEHLEGYADAASAEGTAAVAVPDEGGDQGHAAVTDNSGDTAAVCDAGQGCGACCWQRIIDVFRCKGKKCAAPVVEPVVAPVIEPAVVPEPAAQAPVTEASPAETGDRASGTAVPEPGKPVHYVVAGVFADPRNADKLIAGDHLMLGPEGYRKRLYGDGLVMVYVYSSTDMDAALARRNQLLRLDGELWVYTGK